MYNSSKADFHGLMFGKIIFGEGQQLECRSCQRKKKNQFFKGEIKRWVMFLGHLQSSCKHCGKIGIFKKVTEKIAGKTKKAPKGRWTPGEGTEIS